MNCRAAAGSVVLYSRSHNWIRAPQRRRALPCPCFSDARFTRPPFAVHILSLARDAVQEVQLPSKEVNFQTFVALHLDVDWLTCSERMACIVRVSYLAPSEQNLRLK